MPDPVLGTDPPAPPAAAPPADTPTAAAAPAASLRVDGSAIVYRLYDVGYDIRLDRALDLLAASAPARVRPVRGEAQALQIANPPLTVILGQERVALAGFGAPRDAEVSARIFDFGVVSLRVRVDAPPDVPWAEFVRFGNAVDVRTDLTTLFAHHLRLLTERIRSAVEDFDAIRVAQIVAVAHDRPVAIEEHRRRQLVRRSRH